MDNKKIAKMTLKRIQAYSAELILMLDTSDDVDEWIIAALKNAGTSIDETYNYYKFCESEEEENETENDDDEESKDDKLVLVLSPEPVARP